MFDSTAEGVKFSGKSDTLNTETPLPGGMGEDHISPSSSSEPTYFSDIYGLVSGTLPEDGDK